MTKIFNAGNIAVGSIAVIAVLGVGLCTNVIKLSITNVVISQ